MNSEYKAQFIKGLPTTIFYDQNRSKSKLTPNIPRPCLPDTSTSEALLAQVLRKWRAKKYEKESQRNIIAYLLDHEYSTANLKDGLDCLKGVDAHRVMLLGPIAEQLGFVVGLAGLSHKVSGSANDNGQGYPGRALAMVEVFQKSTRISGIVDLAGASLLSVKHLNLSVKSLIPGNLSRIRSRMIQNMRDTWVTYHAS